MSQKSTSITDYLNRFAQGLSIETQKGLGVGFAAGLSVIAPPIAKDAPYEGFHLLTFIRSPIVGAFVGWVLATQLRVTDTAPLFLATIGGERIVVEGYKLFRAQKPGKFTFGEWGIPKQLKY